MTDTINPIEELESLCIQQGKEYLNGDPTQTGLPYSIATQIYQNLPLNKETEERVNIVEERLQKIVNSTTKYASIIDQTNFLRLIDERPHRSEPIVKKLGIFFKVKKSPLPINDILNYPLLPSKSECPANSNALNAGKNHQEDSFYDYVQARADR